jgi:hypothetical protein
MEAIRGYETDLSQARVEYQVYPEEYFSGADVSIYFGDAWVDEIVSINYSLMEYVQPIFGFNSYTYDAAPRGARLVTGNFRINFKESYYLHKIISEASILDGIGSNGEDPWKSYSADRVEADELVLNKTISNSSDLRELLNQVNDGKLTKEQLLNVAKRIQDSIWEKKTFQTEADGGSPFFNQPKRGFSIAVLYGSRFSSISGRSDYNRIFDLPASTNYTISGVQLTGVNHIITPDGTPVYEDYSFIARDLEPRA